MSPTLTDEQQRAVNDRGGELLVSAAAGSGKTRILVERLLRRVTEEHEDLDRFLVITYTKAAAAELREKITAALNDRLAETPNDAFLRRQKMIVGRAQISTIHSFCSTLLREEGYRINLPADFRVAEEDECAVLKEKALERLLEEHYEKMDENGSFSQLVDTMSAGRDDSRLSRIVSDIHTRVQSHPDPSRWLKDQAKAFDLSGIRDIGRTQWGALLMADARRQAVYWRSRFADARDLLREDPALEQAYAESFEATLDGTDEFLSALDQSWDHARAHCEIPFPRLGSARKVKDPALKDRVQGIRKRCKERLEKLCDIFSDSGADLLADMAAVYPTVRTLLDLVAEFDARYSAEKRRRNIADFSDLEHLALQLLREEEIAHRWEQKYTEVMVDEYQDTNLVQNEIFNAVSGGGERLFEVGDVKQSIYRFRLADPGIFLKKYNSFPDGEKHPPESGARKLVLSYNFRSRASVIDAVNFVFTHIMSADFGELNYTADQRLRAKLPYPPQESDATELDIVDMAALEDQPDEAKISRDAAEAEFVAKRVRRLLDEGHPVTEGDGFRPVRPEDIAILYRSPGSVLRHLGRALDRQRIPWTGDDKSDFFSAEEVSVAMAFLEIADNPRQDIPLLAVLTCPVYRFSGDDLAGLRAKHRAGDIYDCLKAGAARGEEKPRHFLDDLNALRACSADLSGAGLLQMIYDRTSLLAVYGATEGGAARQENLILLAEYVRDLESGGYTGVFTLTTQLRRLRESGRNPAAGGAAGTGVQVMSIHKSKGLEFPVVILAGLNRNFNRSDMQEPVLFHPQLGVGPSGFDPKLDIEYPTIARRAVARQLEREMKAEEMRLLYVAMTRAREKLILVAASTNWAKQAERLAPDTGPYPDPEALNERSSVAEWLLLPVLARADAAVLCESSGISCPSLPSKDRWDIHLVPAEAGEAVRQRATKAAEEGQHVSETAARRLLWKNPNALLADTPSKATATQLKGRALDAEAAEDTAVQTYKAQFPRPRFDQRERGLTASQIGTAVHTVMQLIRPSCADSPEAVTEEIRRLEAQKSLTPQEAAAVRPEQIAAFFSSPLGREAAAADDLRREFKFSVLESAARLDPTLPEEEQVLLQGVIDCCFTGSSGLTVVDFKTDRVRPGEETAHSARYRTQLDVYTSALSRMTGTPVTRRVVWYLATGYGAEI